MANVIEQVEAKYKKKAVPAVQSGDTVRVHQKISEAGKDRVQVFEGLVIKVSNKNSLSATVKVRRVTSGVGVEKTYLLHSPSVLKVEVTKRSKVRRNYLTHMRGLTGRSARLRGVDFDKDAINSAQDKQAEAEEERIHEEQVADYDPEAAKAEKDAEKAEAEAATDEKVEKSAADKIEEHPKERPEANAPAEPQNKQKS
jgi:large subunit ribosomal protein L19